MGWRSQDVIHHTAQHCHLTVFLPVITTSSSRAFQHPNRAGCRKPMAKRVPDKLKLQSPNSGTLRKTVASGSSAVREAQLYE
jgi:hypothetical protein